MYCVRVRLRAGLATVLAGLVLLPVVSLPVGALVPLAALLAVAVSWWLVPADRLGRVARHRS